MSEKRATVTFNYENLKEFDRFAEKKGMNRTALLNFLISEFVREEQQRERQENKEDNK